MKQRPVSVHVTTMGCSKNLVDSEVLMGWLRAAGYKVIHQDKVQYADIAIVNTCGFIEDSITENINQILEIIKAKENGLVDKVYVMGCLVQRFKDDLRHAIPEVDHFYGVDEIGLILKDLGVDYRHELTGERMISTPSHYAYLKISEGCDRNCAFCTIPAIRGKNKSKSIEEICDEAASLASKGVKEIILIAQDITRYGVDVYGKKQLPKLLRELDKVEGIYWIRLQYTYPDNVLYEIIDLMKNSSKLCHYLDIPLQHIDSEILKSMNRGHSRDNIMDILQQFREEIPDIAIRTTFITGYPGETEEKYSQLKDFIQSFRFDRLGVFPFSPEKGTAAADLNSQVPMEVRQKRAEEIMVLQQGIARSLNHNKIGDILTAIVDRKEGDSWVLRSQYDSPEVDTEIFVAEDQNLTQGHFYQVKIISAEDYDLNGSVLEA
ncbi:MAG: 30S ribosomal protein S12 methylthiotransferase RimO [Bacteroidales bacterium]